MDVAITQEQAAEFKQVEELVRQAFHGQAFSDQTEHLLVKRLRSSSSFVPGLSLVAKDAGGNIIGHILLTKAHIIKGDRMIDTLVLAPVSVLPAYQRCGVGSRLIGESLEQAKQLGFSSVMVLGHPEYYPKFGFEPAVRWDIQSPFEVPTEAFMALELEPGALDDTDGVLIYSEPFSGE